MVQCTTGPFPTAAVHLSADFENAASEIESRSCASHNHTEADQVKTACGFPRLSHQGSNQILGALKLITWLSSF
jgi:hypothetical protein